MRNPCTQSLPTRPRSNPSTPTRRRLRFEPLEDRCLLATFTVVNTLDSGPGSLRQALLDANASVAGGEIVFQIPITDPNFIDVDAALTSGDPDPDAWRFQPLSELPALSRAAGSVTIDGRTQTTLAGDLNPFGPEIVLDGNGVAAGGIVITTNNHAVLGLNIQRFGFSGITILGGDNNTIAGNYIGVNATGAAAAANGRWGVVLASGASRNLIGTNADGTTDAAERNVISGNSFGGIGILEAGSDLNVVAGNYIGASATATAAIGNANRGVDVYGGAQRNRIGTNADGIRDDLEANVIGGNAWAGVSLNGAGTMHNVVAGNFIGTNSANATDLGNKQDGVLLFNGATQNTIGGAVAAARNVISGNALNGVRINGAGTSQNAVFGNYVGMDGAGNSVLPNQASGVLIDTGAAKNVIGTDGNGVTDSTEGNLISGGSGSGVRISGAGAAFNSVAGNLIGVKVNGLEAAGNQRWGVVITAAASDNRIGTNGDGTADAAERNVISGNLAGGVGIVEQGSDRNLVAGNYIGISSAGTAVIGNLNRGVDVFSGAKHNRIGTNADGIADVAERNVISGNGWEGVSVSDAGSSNNLIAGNFIGADATGTVKLPNLRHGVAVWGGATSNTVGGTSPAARNLISGNAMSGVNVSSAGTAQTVVAGNWIGLDVTGVLDLGNTHYGVLVEHGATQTAIGGDSASAGNTIAFNGLGGAAVTSADAADNAIARNSIYSNVGLGIDIGANGITPNDSGDADTGSNNVQNFPELSGATLIGQTLTMQFAVPSTTPNSNYPLRIEFFKADTNAQEGQTFLGFANYAAADAELVKTFSFFATGTIADGDRILATATDAAGNTSEFSATLSTTVQANPWHNTAEPLDVNGDTKVVAGDALAVINFLNAFDGGPVSPEAAPGPNFYDTTNDGSVSPLDALAIINAINAGLTEGESAPNFAAPAYDHLFATLAADPTDLLLALLDDTLLSIKPRKR